MLISERIDDNAMNKIMRLGSLFFTIVLFGYAVMRYSAAGGNSYIYYLIAALGFLVVYLSYSKKK